MRFEFGDAGFVGRFMRWTFGASGPEIRHLFADALHH